MATRRSPPGHSLLRSLKQARARQTEQNATSPGKPRPPSLRPGQARRSARPSAGTKSKPIILLVEDDPAIAGLIQSALKTLFAVHHAHDGAEALALLTHLQPALVISDVMMPGMDGFTLANRLRQLPGLENTPVIFLTAKDTPQDHIRGIQLGAKSYITKPFKLKDLLEKVNRAIRKAK